MLFWWSRSGGGDPGTTLTTWSSIVVLAGVVASIAGADCALRFGRPQLVAVAALASVAIAVALAFSGISAFVAGALALIVYSIAILGDSGALTAGVVDAAHPELQGATLALHSLVGFLGAALWLGTDRRWRCNRVVGRRSRRAGVERRPVRDGGRLGRCRACGCRVAANAAGPRMKIGSLLTHAVALTALGYAVRSLELGRGLQRIPHAEALSDAPLLSIVVPARNEDRNIADCVRSLVAQTGLDVEVIVVDDASTDTHAR